MCTSASGAKLRHNISTGVAFCTYVRKCLPQHLAKILITNLHLCASGPGLCVIT